MTRRDKLLTKLAQSPENVRFHDLCAAAESHGFIKRKVTGSHHRYSHPLHPSLALNIQPKAGKAKGYQVRQLLMLIERYNLSSHE